MKKATQAWLEFAHRDLEAAKLLAENEYVSKLEEMKKKPLKFRALDDFLTEYSPGVESRGNHETI